MPTTVHVGRLTRLGALLGGVCLSITPAHTARAQAAEPPLADLYALAIAEVFRDPPHPRVELLPSASDTTVRIRVRYGKPMQRSADRTIARQTTLLLARRGFNAPRAALASDSVTAPLRIVLGRMNLEPSTSPTFARLALGLIGSDGSTTIMKVLLRKERQGWRVLSFEAEDD